MPRPSRRRHFGSAALSILAAGAMLWLPAEASQTETKPGRTSIIAYICKSAAATVTPWRNTVTRAIGRALTRTDGVKVQVRGEAECGAFTVEVACNAGVYDKGGPILACSPDTLLMLIKVAGWYAIAHASNPDEDYEAFRNRHPARLGLSAFTLAGQSHSDASLQKALDALRAESEATDPSASKSRMRQIFEGILDLTYAALIGHESGHLESTVPYCAVAEQSRVEQSGLWKVLVRIAAGDELYKRETPVIDEVRADRCATRRIRVARSTIEHGTLSPADQEFVRRAAADIVSTLLFIRFGPGGTSASIMKINDAYLYAPLRIAALAGEIGFDATGPVICGGAAENLTGAAQHTFQQRPGNGLMPDEMEHLFPKGVIDAWERRADWSAASFSCHP